MKTKDIIISLFAILILGSIVYLWMAPSGAQKAPAITLQLLDGKKLELSSLEGKPVLITFWATSCPGCIKEMPHLVELYPEYVMEMIKRKQVPYKIALDLKGEAVKEFGNVSLTPTTFLLDGSGKIVKKKINEMDMASWKERIKLILKNS